MLRCLVGRRGLRADRSHLLLRDYVRRALVNTSQLRLGHSGEGALRFGCLRDGEVCVDQAVKRHNAYHTRIRIVAVLYRLS